MRSDRPRRHAVTLPANLSVTTPFSPSVTTPVTTPVTPAVNGSSRRRWLQHALALGAGISGTLMSFKSHAGKDKASSGLPIESDSKKNSNNNINNSDSDTAPPAFMQLSQTLTGKKALNAAVGARLFNALKKNSPDFLVRIRQLATALHSGWPNVTKSQQVLAMKILRGWYLGIVDHAVVTYSNALMFRSVANASIPSYCNDRPDSWSKKPMAG